MKLRIKFNYEVETNVNKKEWEALEMLLENGIFEYHLNKNVNKLFLIGDGREEKGGISDFNCEVEE